MKKLLIKTVGILSSLGSIYLNSAVVNNDCESSVEDQFLESGSRCTGAAHSITIQSSSAAIQVMTSEDLVAGSHLVSPRKFYVHHGIYLGDGKVAHYSGLSSSLQAGPIVVTDLEHFASGNSVLVHPEHCGFPSDEIIDRALSRVGESQYKILSNNCEHFCNWCIYGHSYSSQVSKYFHQPLRLFRLMFSSKTGLIA
ncbi:lecithin retinol acyltransferase family protein [Pseudomonas sp. SDO55104_S430]